MSAKEGKKLSKESGRYNLRRLSIPSWSAVFGKKPQSPNKKEKAGNLSLKNNMASTKKVIPSKAQLKAVEKIKKQQTPARTEVKPKKSALKAKIVKTLTIPMSTPKKQISAKVGNKDQSVELDESPKLSPIILVSDAQVTPLKDSEKKNGATKIPKYNNPGTSTNENVASPPKKQKISPVKARHIHNLEQVREELKRKLAPKSHLANPEFKVPSEVSRQNSLQRKLARKSQITVSVLTKPAQEMKAGSSKQSITLIPVKPKPETEELNSESQKTLDTTLDYSGDFLGFTDEDIPDNISEIESYLFDQENFKEPNPVIPNPVRGPSQPLPPLVQQSLLILPKDQQAEPSQRQRGVPTVNPKTVYGQTFIRTVTMTQVARPLQEIHLNGHGQPTAKKTPILVDKASQTENNIRNVNLQFLLMGEPFGSLLFSGSVIVSLDKTNKFKYDLHGLNFSYSQLSPTQKHSTNLQIRQQITSYLLFNEPKAGDVFPIYVLVNPQTLEERTNQRAITFSQY